jgi:trehalose 6-phosphate synthase
MDRNMLLGLYNLAGRSGGVTLVTSDFEGQHLGALESIAAQDPDTPSVLVIGANTGAAQQLGDEGPLLIDPYNIEASAEVLKTAFAMPNEERRERHSAMQQVISRNDARHWGHHALIGV